MPYVVYAMSHTYLTRCLHHVPSEAMMSDVLGTHEYAWGPSATGHVVAPEPSGTGAGPEPQDTCQYRSPVERWSLNLGHVATRRTFLRRGRAWSHEVRGNSGAVSYRLTGSVPRCTWKHRSPLMASDAHGASRHVATSEPFPDEWHGARGDTGALF
jgi:hypothetical protein